MIVFGIVCSAVVSAQQSEVLWLDELDYSNVAIGWGSVQANKSVDKNPLTVCDQQYDRGVGTHALSEFMLQLDGQASRFSAWVGIDKEIAASPNGRVRASAEFIVLGDDKVLFNSGTMKADTPAKQVDVDLKGVKQLRLIAGDAGDGIDYDHADWAMARIDYAGSKPVLVEPACPEPYILTPKPGPKPRITGPKAFGVRPGSPFLFTVTATGDRPMTFEVKGLPKGLKLDSETGRITGVLQKEGKYKTTVIAKIKRQNQTGFTIAVGDTILPDTADGLEQLELLGVCRR